MTTATLPTPTTPPVRPELAEWRKQDAAIAKLAEQYLPLKVNGIDDKQGLARVHEARMDVKSLRVAVEKKRVQLKADALEYGRAVDTEAKRLTKLLEPIESHLEAEEQAVKDEIERRKREAAEAHKAKVRQRFEALKEAGWDGDYMAVPEMTDGAFAEVLTTARASKAERDRLAAEEAKRRAEEAERLRVLEQQAAEEQRKKDAAEAEARRQAEAEAAEKRRKEDEALAAERTRLAEERRIQEEQTAKQRAEFERLAAERRAEQDRIEREQAAERERLAEERRQVELEKARQEAAERARVETEHRLKREASEREEQARLKAERDKAEAEAREAARLKAEAERPQREKLLAIADQLREIGADVPDQPNLEAAQKVVRFLDIAEDEIRKVCETLADPNAKAIQQRAAGPARRSEF